MSSENATLTVRDFAKKLIQKLGKGNLVYARDDHIKEVKITEFGSRYIYVIDNPAYFTVGIESIRGFYRADKNDSGVEAAYTYIKRHETEGWFKEKPTGPASLEFAKRRSQIEKMVARAMNIIDPEGDNARRWVDFFASLSDKDFAKFMDNLKTKKSAINVIFPNMKKVLKIPNLLEAAKEVGLKLSHRLWLPDKTHPGKFFLTNEKYLVLELPIRRAQQEWDKKLSVPSRDTHVDALTGQVMMDDRACNISTPEIQSLCVRGLSNVLDEFVRVRGGDVQAYGEFNRQLQETGEAKVASLDPRTRARASVVAKVLLQSMMIDNNL